MVGSSANSVDRVLSYFEKNKLFLDKRRGLAFMAARGFKDFQLSIIPLDPKLYSKRDMKLLEAYYIKELNSVLNTQRTVYVSPEPTESALPFVQLGNRDWSIPVFVYGPDLSRVLYIFPSRTAFHGEFRIDHRTVAKYLNSDVLFLDYFSFKTELVPNSNLDELLSFKELIQLRENIAPIRSNKAIPVELIDVLAKSSVNTPSSLYFPSLIEAVRFLKTETGSADHNSVRKCLREGTVYKKRWRIRYQN